MSKQTQLLYVLTRSIVDSTLTIPLVKFHSQAPNHMPRLDCPSVSAETLSYV